MKTVIPVTSYETPALLVDPSSNIAPEQREELAMEQWKTADRLAAMTTILGREVEEAELTTDPDLAGIAALEDPGLAVWGLGMLKTIRSAPHEPKI